MAAAREILYITRLWWAYTFRFHRTLTLEKEILKNFHPQGTARNNKPRSSVFL